MKMNKSMKTLLPLAAAMGSLALATSANAATILVDEDWQTNALASELLLIGDTTSHPGWIFAGTGTHNVDTDVSNRGIPGGAEGSNNQAVRLNDHADRASYDTGHSWSSTDEFSLTFNATEANWSNASARIATIEIKETLSGDTLWTQDFVIPEYDTDYNSSTEDWSLAQTFTVDFAATDFIGGTETSDLSFVMSSSNFGGAQRGVMVDNINLTLVPEPSSTLLIGLGGLALILRRRR